MGCYVDNSKRLLPNFMNLKTICNHRECKKKCEDAAISSNSNAYGLESGSECWYGNITIPVLSYGIQAADSICTIRCNSFDYFISGAYWDVYTCGGAGLLQMFQLKSDGPLLGF